MNYKNNLELSTYLRSFGIFDTNIISAIEEIPIEFFKNKNINKNVSLKQKNKNKFDKQFNDAYLAAVIAKKFQLKSNEKILEIGTGSGYLTAIFSRLSRKVYTLEKFKTLYVLANNNFKKLKLTNIKSKCDDGFNGWEEEAPFDKIFISVVVNQVNNNLIKQINCNGKFILPKLSSSGVQILQLFKVDKNKSLSKIEDICEVNFNSFKTF
jgi:protein-L-isoaspartate(D-aspartate) O-methyltransferase